MLNGHGFRRPIETTVERLRPQPLDHADRKQCSGPRNQDQTAQAGGQMLNLNPKPVADRCCVPAEADGPFYRTSFKASVRQAEATVDLYEFPVR